MNENETETKPEAPTPFFERHKWEVRDFIGCYVRAVTTPGASWRDIEPYIWVILYALRSALRARSVAYPKRPVGVRPDAWKALEGYGGGGVYGSAMVKEMERSPRTVERFIRDWAMSNVGWGTPEALDHAGVVLLQGMAARYEREAVELLEVGPFDSPELEGRRLGNVYRLADWANTLRATAQGAR